MTPKCASDRVGGSSQVFSSWHHQIKLIKKKEPLDLATTITSLDSSNAALFSSPGGKPHPNFRDQPTPSRFLLATIENGQPTNRFNSHAPSTFN